MLLRNLIVLFAIVGTSAVGADVPLDNLMGTYEGEWKGADEQKGNLTAKVAPLGDDAYEALFLAQVDQEVRTFSVQGKKAGNEVKFSGTVDLGADAGGKCEIVCAIAESGLATGTYKLSDSNGTLSAKKTTARPATVGAKPPKDAVVLFDGKDFDHWTMLNGKPAAWKLVAGDAMEVVRGGDIITKQKFNDHKLHIEFRTPYLPTKRGQARGNSGVYVQNRLEVQVLDSFGQPPRDNEAGGIYHQAKPKENASLPPGEWQAYDITYKAPRYQDGKQIEPPEITIVYNGVLIHDKVKIADPSGGGVDSKGQPAGLRLQDHGDAVQFRNIWAVPLD